MSNSTHHVAPAALFHLPQEFVKGLTPTGTDGNRIETPAVWFDLFLRDQIDLVENQQLGNLVQVKVSQDAIHRANLLLKARIGEINDMQQQVRIGQLLELLR